MQLQKPNPWHAMSVENVSGALETSPETGLSTQEAQDRLRRFGPNEIAAERNRSVLMMVLAQFNDITIWILLAATLISLVVGDKMDAAVIVAIVILNAVLGVVQEFRAEQSLEALKQMSAPTARVVRDSSTADVPAREVVPGDVLLLETGSVIAADARVAEAARMLADEALLTGEAEPVEKSPGHVAALDAPTGDRYGMVYGDTAIVGGRGRALVVATGAGTEVGRIAALLSGAKSDQTPVQRRLTSLGKWLAAAVIACSALVFVAGLLRGEPPVTMFLTSVSLAVAAIPEGLPAVVTIVLAVGMRNMARRNALVRRLQAVETLGATTVICTDKTGTLTKNQMTVRRWWTPGGGGSVGGTGYEPEGAIHTDEPVSGGAPASGADSDWLWRAAVACNDAEIVPTESGWAARGDPTEAALIAAGAKAGISREVIQRDWPRTAEAPFDSDRKRMATVHRGADGTVVFVKGAPDGIRPLCNRVQLSGREEPMSDDWDAHIRAAGLEMADQALRVLGFAYRRLPTDDTPDDVQALEEDLTFVGLLGMMDPPRDEARPAVEACFQAGIRPVMITGDHPTTALAVAREIGLADGAVMSGREIAASSDTELSASVNDISVFARVSPEDKLRIIGALKSRGEVVAMTGDGVNDAPALKRADIGVAMGQGGTDVAKGASDMVLTDDNFATIVAAVEEGRTVFSNIRKAIFYLLSCNTSEVLTLFVALMVGWHPPLIAVQILWVNLVTDGLPALALGVEPTEKGVMRRPPRNPKEGVLTREAVIDIALYGVFITLAVLTAFRVTGMAHTGSHAEDYARTAAFLTISFSQLVHALNCRSFVDSIVTIGALSNLRLVGAIAVSSGVQLAAVYLPWGHRVFRTEPLHGRDLLLVAMLSLVVLFFGEARKAVRRHYRAAPA